MEKGKGQVQDSQKQNFSWVDVDGVVAGDVDYGQRFRQEAGIVLKVMLGDGAKRTLEVLGKTQRDQPQEGLPLAEA